MHQFKVLSACVLFLGLGISSAAAQLGSGFPTATAYEVPVYPPLPRQARIQGEVRVEVITDGKSVTSAHAVSGHPLLSAAAAKNAETWQFEGHQPTKFTMTYEYRIVDGAPSFGGVALRSPGVVEVSAPAPTVYAVFSKVGMGTWKLQTSTEWGTSEMKLKPYRSHYSLKDDREALDGKVAAANGQESYIEYGRLDGNRVEFCVETMLPGGVATTTTLYKGEMNGDAMAGTFSDAAGTNGTWNAKRTQDEVMSATDEP